MFSRQRIEWCKWLWRIARAELVKCRVPFWRWPQVALYSVQFVWRYSREIDMGSSWPAAIEAMRGAPKAAVSE